MLRRVVISGCSGGGKSALLTALSDRGLRVFEEPGRAIVRAELDAGGTCLPWADALGFAQSVITRAIAQWHAADEGCCFFDRGLVDAVTWYERQTVPIPPDVADLVGRYRYAKTVFLAPPWPEIYVNDHARRHTFADAVAEYEALLASYPAKGYDVVILPKLDIKSRAEWLLDRMKDK